MSVRAGLNILALLGFLLVASSALFVLRLRLTLFHRLPLFVALATFQGGLYLGALLVLRKAPASLPAAGLAIVLVAAAATRAFAFFAPVFLSNDINRYVWDGRVAAAGINPYRYVPDDPHLARLRDPVVWPHINRARYARTVYPPATQLVFLAAQALGSTRRAMKLVLLAFEAAGVALLIALLRRRQQDPTRILIYAWHPLALWEIAGAGHIDAVLVFLLPLALWAALGSREIVAGIAIGVAGMTKFYPLALLPALTPFRRWRTPLACFVVCVALYLPYLSVGWRVFGFLPGYVGEEHLARGSGYWLADALYLPGRLYLPLAGLILVGLAAAAWRASVERAGEWAMRIAVAALILVSPHYPWYYLWQLPLLTLIPFLPALWPTLVAPGFYLWPAGGEMPFALGLLSYGGFAALAAARGIARAKRSLP